MVSNEAKQNPSALDDNPGKYRFARDAETRDST